MEPLAWCTRCGGFTTPEKFRDFDRISFGWRCLLCGEMVDGVILRNRAVPLIASPMDEEPGDSMQESDADDYGLETMTGGFSNLTQRDVI